MKNVIIILLSVMSLSMTFTEKKKVETIKVKTSAICEECKERIENALNYTKGIVFAELDLETNVIEIKFKTKLLTKVQVKKIITDVGYHADDLERNAEAFNELPGCCKDVNAKCSKVGKK